VPVRKIIRSNPNVLRTECLSLLNRESLSIFKLQKRAERLTGTRSTGFDRRISGGDARQTAIDQHVVDNVKDIAEGLVKITVEAFEREVQYLLKATLIASSNASSRWYEVRSLIPCLVTC
jgi:hypothetical protein